MFDGSVPSLHQGFLPTSPRTRAFVWKYSPVHGGRRPRHFHAEPELNLVLSGVATFGIGERVVRVTSGELIGFPAGQDHVLLAASPDLYLYAIGMDPRFSSEVLGGDRDSVAFPVHLRLTRDDFLALSARASRLVEQAGMEQQGAELWEQAHWARRRHASAQNGRVHVLTRRTLSVVFESPDLGLAPLARKLRANPSEISRYFHRDVGMTLARYRTRSRLLRFIQLVDDGNHNLTATASAAGFGSYSQCHRSFRAELGCAPRQFLSALRHDMQLAYEP